MVTPTIPSSKSAMESETKSQSPPPLVMNLLSPDCRGRVFRFLTLFDCLRFAETSRTSLEHILVEVDRRRRDQFLVHPCEELTASGDTILNLSTSILQSELPPGDELVGHNNNNDNGNGNGSSNGSANDKTQCAVGLCAPLLIREWARRLSGAQTNQRHTKGKSIDN